ncbi:MAG: response regulator transcription factor [Lachnospiraceae bacterium]|nr:response regulator transcription factor [Lachnospiraceae bacterium]
MSTILLVEDDEAIVDSLSIFLSKEGYTVLSAYSIKEALSSLSLKKIDLLLLDVSLPDGNGFSICKVAKEKGLAVMFLTASGDENSVVKGFDVGADDYISKPFRPRELLARIKNVMRRYDTSSTTYLGNVEVDTQKGLVKKNNTDVVLSALEYRLLVVFINNRGRLLSRNQLLENIWDIAGDFVNDNTLTVYIKRLREKIEDDPSNPTLIKTVRGIGYRLD